MTEYRLVPVEPTPEMIEAVGVFWRSCLVSSYQCRDIYAAMLSAAPPAPTREEVAQIEALLDGADLVAGHVDHDSDAEIGKRFIGKRHLIRAILSLLGRRP